MVLTLALVCPVRTLAVTVADTFKTRCSACHGPSGAGNTMIGKNLKLRDFSSPDVQKQTDGEIAAIIAKGKASRMPPFEGKLTKEQIGELVKFIRSLKK